MFWSIRDDKMFRKAEISVCPAAPSDDWANSRVQDNKDLVVSFCRKPMVDSKVADMRFFNICKLFYYIIIIKQLSTIVDDHCRNVSMHSQSAEDFNEVVKMWMTIVCNAEVRGGKICPRNGVRAGWWIECLQKKRACIDVRLILGQEVVRTWNFQRVIEGRTKNIDRMPFWFLVGENNVPTIIRDSHQNNRIHGGTFVTYLLTMSKVRQLQEKSWRKRSSMDL